MTRVLVVGDVHAPVTHPGYLQFCKDLYRKNKCNHVHFIGDVIDHHAISFHARDPDAPGARDEYNLAFEHVQKWRKAFPVATVSIGNHDERVARLSGAANIPAPFLRDYSEVWETPDWTWERETEIDGVYYFHGTGFGGMHPAFNAMRKMAMSCVIGHVHTAGGVKWLVNPKSRMFGMDVGCGLDETAAAAKYAQHFKQRSVLSAGLVLDGEPLHKIMPCSPGEQYHRSNFVPKEKRKR